ncbi:hypothetical protein BU25DRAFT_457340 [Macroventuria anomochaeta]|uniref:Uncharacterized protein n=1 Tax=Macroventuria anomochaeta TaxID=301207 RepID=A0ACB6S683_9PLEO|nr:uncharacterized protein BU25DRAFT_457340 [Macroventuria anomochaeta]KAF2629095.1 hypothetical protein BU25DRAFT_457340 [Macroventuria anomochaeta]
MKGTTTAPETCEHISMITSELTEIISQKSVAQSKIPDANAYYAAKMFPNFHEWRAFRNTSTKAADCALTSDLITSMHSFGDCLTMASEYANELRLALKAEGPEYTDEQDSIIKMLPRPIFSLFFLTMTTLAPVASASGASDRYDPFNHCGAPFCGSTGNVAAAGALARVERNGTAGIVNDKLNDKLPKM